jgi:excisionase family DNA binding protein
LIAGTSSEAGAAFEIVALLSSTQAVDAALTVDKGKLPRTQKEETVERKTHRVSEVVKITGLGRSTIYKLIDEGELRRIKIGASTLIPADDVNALVQCRAA